LRRWRAVDRLQFGLPIPDAVAADEVAEQKLAANAETDPFAARALQSAEDTPSASSADPADLESIPHATMVRPSGFEQLTYGSGDGDRIAFQSLGRLRRDAGFHGGFPGDGWNPDSII